MTTTHTTIADLTRTTLASGDGKLVNLRAGTLVRITGTNHHGTPSQTFLVETVDGRYGAEVCASYLNIKE